MKIQSLSLAALLLSGVAVAAPIDKYEITPEEHAACDSDAIMLCAATYPDEDELLACMRTNLRKLSRSCSVAFTAGLKRRHMPL